MMVRDGTRIFAIHDRCSHRGCSLSDGQIDGEQVVCSCHGSRFDLRDGAVRGGPASAPQPAFQVRERGGLLEVRRLQPV
jgi:nitrite reductase/ring-hydroxylating ferredoxin subunit